MMSFCDASSHIPSNRFMYLYSALHREILMVSGAAAVRAHNTDAHVRTARTARQPTADRYESIHVQSHHDTPAEQVLFARYHRVELTCIRVTDQALEAY